jgi:hypothetical protein
MGLKEHEQLLLRCGARQVVLLASLGHELAQFADGEPAWL